MELAVRKVCQSASGGSYVVIYRAEFALTPAEQGVSVAIAPDYSVDDPLCLVDIALDAIREGFELVLEPRHQGADVVVHYLILHPVDFKHHSFKRFTAEALAKLLSSEERDRSDP